MTFMNKNPEGDAEDDTLEDDPCWEHRVLSKM